MGLDARQILEIAHMAQLIDLVRPDGLNAHELLRPGDVGFGSGHSRNAGAGIGDLGGGAVFQEAILRATRPGGFKHIQKPVVPGGEMVDDIGVVPEDAEIRRGGLHGG